MFANLRTDELTTNDVNLAEEQVDREVLEDSLDPEVVTTAALFHQEEIGNNFDQETLHKKWDVLLKIICVGGYTGGADTKGLLIRDYMRTRPVLRHSNPLIGVNFLCHGIHLPPSDSSHDKERSVMLQIWEIPEQERFRSMARFYFRDACGALVFWGPKRPSSLQEALASKDEILQQTSGSPTIPIVLVTDNTKKEQWIGPGKIFESTQEVDEFCREQNFAMWCELSSRDWDSGEDSVLGHAVHEVVREIFKRGIGSSKSQK